MTTKKVISLNVAGTHRPEDIEERGTRLEMSGYMRMMQIAEPRLSELVAKYKAKGYDVEILPVLDETEETMSGGGGCGSKSSCSSAASSGGCSSGGCGSGASAAADPTVATQFVPRAALRALPGVGTIYVRLRA